MNRKRQTIWLVSMLSIMVVLSAYYLFSDNVKEMDVADSGGDMGRIVANLLDDGDELEIVDEGAFYGTGSGTGQRGDESVLDLLKSQAAAVSGSDYFLRLEMEREDWFSREIERLYGIANDSAKTNAEIAEALETVAELQLQQQALEQIESRLLSMYENAIVIRNDNEWQVVVQTPKLEKSEALSIIELVMSELEVGPESIRVQVSS